MSNWADECDDDDERPTRSEVIELPTAPRSARILEDDSIPYEGPFVARVSNLPFDTNEDEIAEFFIDRDIVVHEMRLPRENDRLRGSGNIEFATREDLIGAIMISDTTIRNRRIRIELANENDNRDRGGMRKRYDYGPREGNNDNTNWRDRKDTGGNGSFEDNRRENRDRGGDRDNRRGGDYNRSNFQNRHDSNNNDDMNNWRMGERDSSPQDRRRYDRNNDRRGGDRRDNYERRAPAPEEERPIFKLAPRTKPLPVLEFPTEKELDRHSNRQAENHQQDDAENHDASNEKEVEVKIVPKPKPIPNAAVFGDAKPVDTAAREREIEEKIAHERKTREEAAVREQSEPRSIEQQPEVKKDIIVIKTERTRLQEEANNWRQHEEPSSEPPRVRDNNRRFNDRRSEFALNFFHLTRDFLYVFNISADDDRSMRYKDGRNFNNNQRGNDNFRHGNGNRGGPRGNSNEYIRRDLPRRDQGGEIKRHVKDPEDRMPKLKPSSGPVSRKSPSV